MPKSGKRVQIFWTCRARRELWEIVDGLMVERSSAAERWLEKIARVMEDLQVFPEMGRVVPEFHQMALREILLPPYRLIYRVNTSDQAVHILTMFHSHRILPVDPPE